MALINCPECSKQVSDRASSCPVCGHPINADIPEKGAITTTTIQATSKKWKTMQLVGTLILIFGIVASCSADKSSGSSSGWPAFVILAGLVVILYARFSAWWHHG